MNPGARSIRGLGTAVWLLVGAARGLFLDIAEADVFARRRLAAAIVASVWKPLPTLSLLGALTGLIAGLALAEALKLYHAELAIAPPVAIALAREIAPLVVGVFAAGRISVDVASRLGSMHLGREIEALEALGQDPARYTITPVLAAVVLAAPVHVVAVFISGWLVCGAALQLDAVLPWATYVSLTLNDETARALLTGVAKSTVMLVIAVGIGAAIGSRQARTVKGVADHATRAFTAGLIAVFLLAALWSWLL